MRQCKNERAVSNQLETMVAIAIFSTDPVLRGSLERLLREDPAVAIVGVVDDASAVLRLIGQTHVDAVVADAPPREELSDWRIRHEQTAFVVLVDGSGPEDSIEALHAGAGAILPRSAAADEIVAAIKAVTNGLAVLPRELVATLLHGGSLPDELPDGGDAAGARLTPRELEVLVAMADGASNKAIARRLEISFHTAKFHVAAILAKLDADSRTEAVTRAAQLGLVML
jgi:DNA-binding NarL/FixJ family response regulator